MTTYIAGTTHTIELEFEDAGLGVLVNPASVQLDITYGNTVGPDYDGPYSYIGAQVPTAGQVYRTGTGLYNFDWTIPASAPAGLYVATWSCAYGAPGVVDKGAENFNVVAPGTTPAGSGDTGFWTGSLTYGGVQVPLGAVDANGVSWMITAIDGMDGAPTSGQVVQWAGDHGGWPTPQWYAPRPISLTVQASAPTQALRDTARAMLQQAVAVSDLGSFVYNEPIPKSMQVRRSGRIIETYPTTLDAVFSIGLIAPDPRKYGASTSITVNANSQTLGIAPPMTPPITLPAQPPPGAATVVNGGNFETRPRITITGPITGPSVYNQTSGRLISFSSLTLGGGDVLVLDLLNRVSYLNGGYIPADLASSWWVLPPGTSQLILQGAGAAGATMTISYSDAWM